MNDRQKKKCHSIIHTNAVAAAGIGAGLAQLPCADIAPLAALEISMTIELGEVFGVQLTRSSARGIVMSVAGTTIGRGISQVLLGWIPGYGNTINATTAASVVEGIGWAVVAHFDA